jgi:integrase
VPESPVGRAPRCARRLDEDEEVPAPTRAEVLRVLRNALNRAIREELIGRNVALLVDMPKVSKSRPKPWRAPEAIQFLRTARRHRLFAAFVLVLVLGFRRGEVLGLRWQDVDLEHAECMPRKQVQRVRGKVVLKDLKTESSQAALPLPLFCLRVLEDRRYIQRLERQIAGDKWRQNDGEDVIFSARHGGLLEPRRFSRTFDDLVTRSGARRITVRIARKTCASLLAWLKVHPKVAQAILRHSQISVTMDIYTETSTEDQRTATDQLAELLEGGINGN